MTTQLELHRQRLLQRDVQIGELWQFLDMQHGPTDGMIRQDVQTFVTEKDLEYFWWLHDWWAPCINKPTTLPTPQIQHFCWFINYHPEAQPVTFVQALGQFYNKAIAHCHTQDIDVTNPGESADERRKRRNRARMATARQHRRVPEIAIKHDSKLQQQVRDLEAQIEIIKQEARHLDDVNKKNVVDLQAAMIAAAELRRQDAAMKKAKIEEIRAQIQTLIAKQ